MPNASHLIKLIRNDWVREEFSAKSLLVKEGALAKKLLLLRAAVAGVGSIQTMGKR